MGQRWTADTVRDYAVYPKYDASDPMHAVVQALPDVDRTLFIDSYWEGKTRREVGEEWGVTGCTISVHLTRILGNIASCLS